VGDDGDLIGYVKTKVGEAAGLTEAQARRLTGSTLREIEADAKTMAKELGLVVEDRARDEGGRFVSGGESEGRTMNRIIREAAGR
jgi:hypothetical protein